MVRDFDGDTDTATLKIKVSPIDMKPTDISGHDSVDETNLDGVITENGTINVNYNGDGVGSTRGNGQFSSSETSLTHCGKPVEVTFANGVYTGTALGKTIFTMTVNTGGTYQFKLFEALDHADRRDADDSLTLNFGVTARDADGDAGTGTIKITVKDDGPQANDDRDFLSKTEKTESGNLLVNDDGGADGENGVTYIRYEGQGYSVHYRDGATITTDDGVLKVERNGDYTFTRSGNGAIEDRFTYVMRDKDGDTSGATLRITGEANSKPTGITGSDTVDETNLDNGTITENGTITVNYHGDGPGTTQATGSFSASDSSLTHCGKPVDVTFANGVYTGATAAGKTIFTMKINANGTYQFKLFDNLDHPKGGAAHNDSIQLRFGVKATDNDGDMGTGTVTINVLDDGPEAVDDRHYLRKGADDTVTGNVTSNDDAGTDHGVTVVKVIFGGQTYTIPQNGQNVSIKTDDGTLKINSTGAYTYTRADESKGYDVFTYEICDCDGDTSRADLKISLQGNNTPVDVGQTATVDETNLVSGKIVKSGTVDVNYNGETPGDMTANGGFSSSTPLLYCGKPVNVGFSGNTYTATADGKTIFTMVIEKDSSYTFKQYDNLDHPLGGSNHNDYIILRFGVTASDSDGDTADGTVRINIRDDGPYARADIDELNRFETRETGNVLGNDRESTDGETLVLTAGRFNGSNGRLDLREDGSYTYTRTSNAAGREVFNYTIGDKDGDTSTATLTITLDAIREIDGGGPDDGCPLVFDLDGDGIELISRENGVMFDINEDGIADKTGWVGADDGILVHDRNEDGIINNHAEMFGDDKIGGFEDLSSYDSNDDGVVDAKDANWSLLQVWQDINGDAYSQADELMTLDQLGIQSISLDVIDAMLNIEGNEVKAVGDAVKTDGTVIDGYDAWFSYEDGAYGSAGEQDTFLFQAITESAATINDFNAAEGDIIDLSLLIEGQDDVTEAINDYVFATEKEGDTVISVDVDGANGPSDAVEIARLEGVSGTSVDELLQNGNIVAD